MSVNLNINNAACVQSVTHIGNTEYVNICSGVSHVVKWGAVDWLIISPFALAVLGIASIALLWLMIKVREIKTDARRAITRYKTERRRKKQTLHDLEINSLLNEVVANIPQRAELLNMVHAARPGHPFNIHENEKLAFRELIFSLRLNEVFNQLPASVADRVNKIANQ